MVNVGLISRGIGTSTTIDEIIAIIESEELF